MPKYSAVFYHAPGATVDTVALEGSKTACTKAARDIENERGWRFVELMAAAQHGVQADVPSSAAPSSIEQPASTDVARG